MSHYYFTEDGYKKIKAEVEELENLIKFDIPRDLATAAEHGDLRENSEYAAAKEKQALSMAKLGELQERLSKARIVRKRDLPADMVTLCKKVKAKNVESGEEVTYIILGDGESDLENGIISYQSPLAQALIGNKIGDVADIDLPGAKERLEIVEIDFYDGP
jgi:transcription elongation factor GreA